MRERRRAWRHRTELNNIQPIRTRRSDFGCAIPCCRFEVSGTVSYCTGETVPYCTVVQCTVVSGHIQLEVLTLLRENNVHVVALPSHISHVLQPLDVSVFGPFKSKVQAERHKLSSHTSVLDVFGAASCLTIAYHSAVCPAKTLV